MLYMNANAIFFDLFQQAQKLKFTDDRYKVRVFAIMLFPLDKMIISSIIKILERLTRVMVLTGP